MATGSSAGPVLTPGVDVSHFQGHVDWGKVREAGTLFAFARVIDIAAGTAGDARFAQNWPAMLDAGLRRGAYCFFRVNHDAAQQASIFLDLVRNLGAMDLPPVLDLEELGVQGSSPQQILDAAHIWLNRVEAGLGKRPIVYTDQNTMTTFLHDSTAFAGYPLWQAAYRATAPAPPKGWAKWHFWQHSSKGNVAGIQGNVDLNWFAGSAAELDAFITGSAVLGAAAGR